MKKRSKPTGNTSDQQDASGCLSETAHKEESSSDSDRFTRRTDFPSAQELSESMAKAINAAVLEQKDHD